MIQKMKQEYFSLHLFTMILISLSGKKKIPVSNRYLLFIVKLVFSKSKCDKV